MFLKCKRLVRGGTHFETPIVYNRESCCVYFVLCLNQIHGQITSVFLIFFKKYQAYALSNKDVRARIFIALFTRVYKNQPFEITGCK